MSGFGLAFGLMGAWALFMLGAAIGFGIGRYTKIIPWEEWK